MKQFMKVKPHTIVLAIASTAFTFSTIGCASKPELDRTNATDQMQQLLSDDEFAALEQQLGTANTINLDCDDSEQTPFIAAFYNSASPPAVVLTRGQDRVIAFIARSGSGARYTAEGVEYWEHQGQASIDWFGTKLMCSPVQ